MPICEALEGEPIVREHTQQIEPSAAEVVVIPNEVAQQGMPEGDTRVEREHRRLQHLIKRLAEQSGYKATIEQPTIDGLGRVDVGLESDGRRIACEICVTTSPEHELANIQKCLSSEYDTVILCSPDRKSLERIKALCRSELGGPEQKKVFFLEPQDVVLRFEKEAADAAGKVDRVKGYKVKVNYQPQQEFDKVTKRKTIAKVVLNSFTRDKADK